MKKFIVITVLILLTPLSAVSGVTLLGMRAGLWQENNEYEKLLYVQGIFDGMIFSKFSIQGTKLSMDLTVSQYVKAIDTLYSDYKNSFIPVPLLLRIITLEIEGSDKVTVEKELETYRKQFTKK